MNKCLKIPCFKRKCTQTRSEGAFRIFFIIFISLQELEDPKQWVLCIIHFNQLPIAHIHEHYEGKPKDADKIPSGPIGNQMKKISEYQGCDPVAFKPVRNRIIDNFIMEDYNMNEDLKKFISWAKAVSCGKNFKFIFYF